MIKINVMRVQLAIVALVITVFINVQANMAAGACRITRAPHTGANAQLWGV